jgi:uncharacterized membrane protein YraQ (UPF0718 family)/copper chaperone CopZ
MRTFVLAVQDTIMALGPALILGLLIAGLLHVLVRRDRVLAHIGRPGLRSSMKAAMVGVPLPLCSCSVLPAALGLRRDGASKGAVTSFLISTPQTGVDSISVAWAMLGWPVALAKVVAAFFGGIIGGVLADRVPGGEVPAQAPPGCESGEHGPILKRIWNYAFGTIFRDIHRWLALGILLSAAITAFVGPGTLANYPILQGPLGLLAALAVGIPLYVCSTASVPIAAGLIHAGFPVGSALVFLMAGPATNAVTMGAVRKALGGRVFAIYLGTVVTVSLATGLLLNALEVSAPAGGHVHGAASSPLITAVIPGGLLFAGIAWYLVHDLSAWIRRRNAKAAGSRDGLLLRIGGMTCHRCEGRVKSALEALPGTGEVTVSAVEGTALIRGTGDEPVSLESAIAAVEVLGYHVER